MVKTFCVPPNGSLAQRGAPSLKVGVAEATHLLVLDGVIHPARVACAYERLRAPRTGRETVALRWLVVVTGRGKHLLWGLTMEELVLGQVSSDLGGAQRRLEVER
jgi:hypothetical protein